MSALAVLTRPAARDTEDHDLVAAVRAGNERAFELLFVRYQPRIAAFVRGMVHDPGRAEDITQEVFISALRRMRETEREITFKPWIYEIAKNACIDAYRRARNASEVSFDAHDAIGADEHGRLAEPVTTPDSAVEGKVALDNLCGAFGGLSPVHHDILVLREFEGLSYREIGDRLGMSRPAVESTLFRARKRLTEEYEELVSGERCRRVQRIVDASDGLITGLRDRRRMARHLAHCQPCRRYASVAGVDLGAAARPARAAARIAAFLPLPAVLRQRWSADEAGPLLGHHGGGPVTQWSANAATVLDPGTASGWAKAIATAATVAVAGVGAGGAFTDRERLGQFGAAGWPAAHAPRADAPGARAHAALASPSEATKRGRERTLQARREWPAMRVGRPSSGDRDGVAATPAGARQAGEHPSQAARDLGSAASALPAAGEAARAGGGAASEATGAALGRVLDAVGALRAPAAFGGRPGVAVPVGPDLIDDITAAVTEAVDAGNHAMTVAAESTSENAAEATAEAANVRPTAEAARVRPTAEAASVRPTAEAARVRSTAEAASVRSTAEAARVRSTAEAARVRSTMSDAFTHPDNGADEP